MKVYSFCGLFLMTLFLSTCSNTEVVTPVLEQFITDEYTDALGNAKIYLTYEENLEFTEDSGEPLLVGNPRIARTYVISDGEFTGAANFGRGYLLDDFENETYAITVLIISGSDLEFPAGTYNQPIDNQLFVGNSGSMEWASTDKQGVLMSTKSPDNDQYYNFVYVESAPELTVPIKISGGTEPGKVMTVEFDGGLAIYDPNHLPTEHPSYLGTGDLYAKSEIIDVRDVYSGARKAQAQPEILSRLLNLKTK